MHTIILSPQRIHCIAHRVELGHLEGLALQSRSGLAEQDGRSHLRGDHQCNDSEHWREDQKANRCPKNVDDTFQHVTKS